MGEEMISVRKAGATVNGHAGLLVTGALNGARLEMADYTRYEVLTQLDKVLQNPTGYYASQIRRDRVSVESYRVHDGGVIYGPWLEGTGSRNAPVTKFGGYHTFRIVGNRMAQKGHEITEAWISRVTKVL